MESESRQFSRAPFPVVAHCRRSDIGEGWSPIAAMNISAVGIGFEIESAVNVGERVQMKIQLPSSPVPLEIFGVVRWQKTKQNRTQVGVEFIDATPEQQMAIDTVVKFLEKHSRG